MFPKILLVDDESASRAALETLLRREGFEVHDASGGAAALAECVSFRPDLVLLDVLMPGMSGFEVCKRIKAAPETRLTPVVLITGLSATEDRIKGINAGADDFLSKPIDFNELLARTRSLIKLKHYTDELENAESVLFSLALSIEARDPYTRGHCDRLSEMSASLGEILGIPEEDVKALRSAGIVHDIGKVAVPDSILLKPGPLSPEEIEVMRKHPVVGEQICEPLKTFRLVLPIIRHHHERYDGSGYPDHLRGSEIPLTARILAARRRLRCPHHGPPVPQSRHLRHCPRDHAGRGSARLVGPRPARSFPHDDSRHLRVRRRPSLPLADSLFPRIDHEPPPAQESNQRQPQFARQLHRKARRSRHRRHNRQPRDDGLLHDLETASSANQKNRLGERNPAFEKGPPDNLVDRVVTSDVLSRHQQFSLRINQCRPVQSAGPAENSLRRPQRIGQAEQDLRVDCKSWIRRLKRSRSDRLDRSFAADTATRSREEIALQLFGISGAFRGKLGPHQVSAVRFVTFVIALDAENLLVSLHEAFGEQKPGGQLEVISRRAHRHAQRLFSHADFQRLLGREIVLFAPEISVVPFHNLR